VRFAASRGLLLTSDSVGSSAGALRALSIRVGSWRVPLYELLLSV